MYLFNDYLREIDINTRLQIWKQIVNSMYLPIFTRKRIYSFEIIMYQSTLVFEIVKTNRWSNAALMMTDNGLC